LAAPAASSSVSANAALNTARLWLRSHSGAPDIDQLAELKNANPDAYALVKALLTKRSLGLLDPKHPTASFSNAGKPREETAEQGPEVFEQFAAPGELQHSQLSLAARHNSYSKVAMPYAEVQPAASHDWLNWKPQAAMDDDTMVRNVLGAVAELKGKKAGFMSTRNNVEERSSENSFTAAVEEELPQPKAEAVQSVVPAKKKNGYMDFSMMADDQSPPETQAAPVAAAPAVKENSYLKGIDLSDDAAQVAPARPAPLKRMKMLKVASSVASGPNYLNSFSWDDDAKPTKPMPRHIAPQASKKESQLLSWLGVVDKAPAPKVVQAPAKPSNPYILDLTD